MDRNKVKKRIGLVLTVLGIITMLYAFVFTDEIHNVLLGLMISSAGMLLSQSVKAD